MVHSDVRRSPRTGAPASPSTALGVRSPISKARKLGTPSRPTASPSPARRRAAEQLRGEKTPQRAPSSASSTPRVGSAPNYKIPEALTVRLNVYDLVWNRNDTRLPRVSGRLLLPSAACSSCVSALRRGCPRVLGAACTCRCASSSDPLLTLCCVHTLRSSTAKNAASGFENLGFGLYHSALEIWGKEISFGHSKRYKSGVFAVKPKRAQVCALRPVSCPPVSRSCSLMASTRTRMHCVCVP
jgi:hypothetical protein